MSSNHISQGKLKNVFFPALGDPLLEPSVTSTFFGNHTLS